jgi:hypothetical protein
MRNRVGVRLLWLTAVLLAASGSAVRQGVAAGVPQDQLKKVLDATVFVKVPRLYMGRKLPSSGSGFFVSPYGHVLTNWHVVAEQIEWDFDGVPTEISTTVTDITVLVGSGTPAEQSFPARIVSLDRTRDLALLKVTYVPTSWLRPPSRESARVTESVWAVGFPFGELLAAKNRNPEVTITGGRVTSVRQNDKGQVDSVQIDAAINPGNSGGPVLDEFGDLLGVSWAKINGSAGTNFAIPPDKLRAFLVENRIGVQLEPDAVFDRAAPIQITVSPRLSIIKGMRCSLALTGQNIAALTVDLPASGDAYSGSLAMPARQGAGGDPTSYQLRVRVVGGDGTAVAERTLSIPIRNAADRQKVGSERDPGAMMRDRNMFGNRAEEHPFLPDEVVTGGGGPPKANALSELAKTVKIKRDADGKAVIDDHTVDRNIFDPKPENYAALPDDGSRRAARGWDELEARWLWFDRNLAPQDRREVQYSQDYDELLNLIAQARGVVAQLGLCRCGDMHWELTTARTKCDDCAVPPLPWRR